MRRLTHLSTQVATVSVLIGVLAQPAAAQSPDEVRYYHSDAVGTVRVITDDTGTVQARYDYQPFGKRWPSSDPADPRMFAGKERDPDTGLDYFGARYFSGETGRFTSVDPFLDQEVALTNPQRWNRYTYGLNNPLRNVDPDGRDTIDLAIGFAQGLWNTAKGIVTLPYALATGPSAVASGLAQDVRLLGYGIAHPGEVLDTYVSLSVSANDADQRALGAAIGEGTAVAALVLAPTVKGTSASASIGPKPGSAGGPGARKVFSRATMDAARAESANCVFCGTPTTKSRGPTQSNIDHAIPKSRGGNNTLPNAQNTCRDCNLRKGARTTEEFLNRQDF